MRRAAIGTVVAIVAFAAAVAAPAAAGQRQRVTAQFTSAVPGTPTGFTVAATYSNGATPPGRPFAIRHVDDGLPPGTVIRSHEIPRCTTSELLVMVLGPAVCPAGSIVGGGTVTLDFGLPGLTAFNTKLTLINAGNQILFLGQIPVLGAGLVEHGVLVGSTIEIRIPPLPGNGPEGATVDAEHFSIPQSSGLLVTPPTCPASGAWTFTRAHTYGDGVTQTARVPLPCA